MQNTAEDVYFFIGNFAFTSNFVSLFAFIFFVLTLVIDFNVFFFLVHLCF